MMSTKEQTMRVYSNFKEIDKDLRLLRLQKEIDYEEMKLRVNQTKESFSVVGVAANLVGSIAKKAFVLKAVNTLLGIKRVKPKNIEN